MSRILVVDDEPLLLESYTRALARFGHSVDGACDGAAAIARFRGAAYDAVITDLAMPDMDGLTFLREVRRFDLDVPVIIVTGAPSLETAIHSLEYGAFRYLLKPVEPAVLREELGRAVRFHELARLRRQALSLVEQNGHALGDRASLEARFESAVSSMRIAFQPIVSLRRRQVVGYEALLRTGEATLARPEHFVDAAVRLARLDALGRVARARTAAEGKSAPSGVRLFVNLHASDLVDDDLVLPSAPLSELASQVTLEITERAALHDAGDLRARLAQLRKLGFRLAIDDLGAGYAGLSGLTMLEPEVVKLDMSLVRGVDVQPAKQEIIRSMARLCADLKMEMIVEGVETTAERDALLAIGCDLMQGFLFARPSFGFEDPKL